MESSPEAGGRSRLAVALRYPGYWVFTSRGIIKVNIILGVTLVEGLASVLEGKMSIKPTFDRTFLLPFVFVMVAVAGVNGYGQCGVYLRRVSTQQVPYAKVYLDRAVDLNGD